MVTKNRGSTTGSADRPDALGPMMVRRVARLGPADRAHGRWLGDLGTLSDAERKLVDKCAAGEICRLGDERPEAGDLDNTIRAELIRFLVLGGDKKHPVHELGVWLKGAWIEGTIEETIEETIEGKIERKIQRKLDLECVRSSVFVALLKCHISGLMRASDAELPGLNLEGTLLHGLDAPRLKVKGTMFLRRGFLSKAEVRLDGAEIGGNLDCDGSDFCDSPILSDVALGVSRSLEQGPAALRAEGIVVKGDVLLGKARLEETLREEKAFSADGEVWLTGANIGGKLTCSGGRFSAQGVVGKQDNAWEDSAALRADGVIVKGDIFLDKQFCANGGVRLTGAQIEGSLHCSGGTFRAMRCQHALDGQRMTVKGKFEAKGTFTGRVNLSAARVGSLVDVTECWPRASLHLDGFHYDRISDSSTDAEARIRWLEKQIPRHLRRDFKPQPWEQLIKVLRDMGHREEATTTAIRKEELWGQSAQMKPFWAHADWKTRLWRLSELAKVVRVVIHCLYGTFAKYGYRPMRTVLCIIIAWFLCFVIYCWGNNVGLFQPAAPAVQISLQNCRNEVAIHETLAACRLPPEYPWFEPAIYSADLILPFVDLQQESNWTPALSSDDTQWISAGRFVRAIVWLEIIVGWLMSLLLLTALGRVLNRD